jgi:signal transduction histidine kinase
MTQESSQTLITSIRTSLERLSTAPLTSELRAELEACSQHLCVLDEAVKENEVALQESKQARSQFVSVVTHELRIPMTSIKGYADLLRSGMVGPVNEQQINFLNVIRNNVERMSALVSDLSDINHIETDRIKLDLVAVSLSKCMDTSLQTLKPRFEDKQQKFIVEVAPDLARVYADAARVTQILTYLIGNAIKFTPAEGQVNVQAFLQGDFVCIEIKDTGIGISPADQAQLFKPFFRSEDASVRDQPGWGLSLCVARRLVLLMGGEIGVRSAPKEGSTFWFTLPVSKDGR